MKIEPITGAAFAPYGRVVRGCAVQPILDALQNSTPLPAGTGYVPEEPALQTLPAAKALAPLLYGGQPVQFGWCNGHNAKLNCLEYHRSSEFNLGTEDFILLLAKQDEIENGALDTRKVRAFRVPAGVLVEIFATTLHYAPCHTDPARGFRVLVALPQGTNTEKPAGLPAGGDAALLWARNKWLLAHRDSAEAAQGAYIGLTGENPDITALL
jgi:hypothetical protein